MAHCSFPGIKKISEIFSHWSFSWCFFGYCLETNDLKVLEPALFGHQNLPQLRERNFVGWKAPLILQQSLFTKITTYGCIRVL